MIIYKLSWENKNWTLWFNNQWKKFRFLNLFKDYLELKKEKEEYYYRIDLFNNK